MFPPPRPWKSLTTVDPDRDYVAFTSRFFLRSPLSVPSFLVASQRIGKQIDAADGAVGWSLGANLATLEFYTLSAWQAQDALREFTNVLAHGDALKRFAKSMRRPSILTYFSVKGSELPLTWKDAIARQDATDLKRPGA